VTTVTNGFECLEELRKDSYDIILMDINMPVIGGLETCHEVRSGEGR
jgi:CheY-like chemotaxis protein